MEEAKALVCWETIKDHVRNEEHSRNTTEAGGLSSPLESLTPEQLNFVKEKYDKYTLYIRVAFIGMTFLALIWDVMLLVSKTKRPFDAASPK